MHKQDLPAIARTTLHDLLDKSGGLLYSSHETIAPGSVYLLGYNPAGIDGPPMSVSIDGLLTRTTNAYLDEDWGRGVGQAKLQKRLKWLLNQLGLDARHVCASNLIFFQSPDAKSIDYALADRCWPVHEAIIALVKPRMLLTFGNANPSPYQYLQAKHGGASEYFPSGHGDWQVKAFKAEIQGRETYVAGLPHLSWYNIINKAAVIGWISAKTGGASQSPGHN